MRSALSKVNGITVLNVTKTTASLIVDRKKVTNQQIKAAVASAGNYSATIQ